MTCRAGDNSGDIFTLIDMLPSVTEREKWNVDVGKAKRSDFQKTLWKTGVAYRDHPESPPFEVPE